MPSKVFISLGSNVGDSLSYLSLAVFGIEQVHSTKVLGKSYVMKTEPVGVTGQPDYLNQVLLIETELAPYDLLVCLKNIEQNLGRVKRARWAEREIDIDIIAYSDQMVDSQDLCIPHKQLLNRLFILMGCVQLMPEYIVLPFKKTVSELFENLDDTVKSQKISPFTS